MTADVQHDDSCALGCCSDECTCGATARARAARFQIYSWGLIYASVCTTLPLEDATERLNRDLPTGIESRWRLADEGFRDGAPNPSPCSDNLPAQHYLFSC